MGTNRRNFLKTSGTAAAGVALGSAVPLGTLDATTRTVAATERVVAMPVHLSKIRLTGGPLQRAQIAAAKYLLELEPDRMMAFYRVRAGLEPKAKPYAGWDGPGRNLTG